MMYEAVGRCMAGTNVVGYKLRAMDGREDFVSMDNVIQLINSGCISNMRLRTEVDRNTGGTNIEVRGKGVNLLSLPKYKVEGNQGITYEKKARLGKYKIVKQVVFKDSCIGYVIADENGNEASISKSKALELCQNTDISNAGIHKTYLPQTGNYRFDIVGIGCSLRALPVVYVDHNGRRIDTTKNGQKYILRATKMRRGGIVYNLENRTQSPFANGDYLVVTPSGGLAVLKASKSEGKITKSLDKATLCDNKLDNLVNYPVELFGSQRQVLTPDVVKRWVIVDVIM